MMTLDDFKENVDIYSADLARWPQDSVKQALQFMQDNKDAKAYFDAALALDSKLRAYEPKPAALAALEARILQEIAKAPREPAAAAPDAAALRFRPAWIFAPGGGLLAMAIIGFLIGLSPQRQADTTTLLDPVFYSQDQIISGDADQYTGGMF